MATNGTANEQSATNGGHTTHNISPKITLYTNHGCPFAQRAHITLDKLNLAYEEVIINLETPRPQWYLDINPRGLVPTIMYSVPGVFDEEIITESAIVAQFLCDSFPSHLLPASKESPSAALTRARIAFFCHTWAEKISPSQFAVMRAESAEEKETKVKATIALIEKEIEPLLANADPFFGGSKDLTFAEVFTAPFVQRWVALAEDGEMVPRGLLEEMEKLPNLGRWTKAVLGHENATRIFEKEKSLEGSRRRLKKMREAQK
ncbi:hypothetical protein LTR66_001967 [Elasticomyces elasticus]|nr:hypothetical protein LTR28_003748 [Elasticomyces elasticus]KAK4998906.1 hypothetical protein LTR66_001967 [Elasticomyces elasticus]